VEDLEFTLPREGCKAISSVQIKVGAGAVIVAASMDCSEKLRNLEKQIFQEHSNPKYRYDKTPWVICPNFQEILRTLNAESPLRAGICCSLLTAVLLAQKHCQFI
jgi:hypothetical protein